MSKETDSTPPGQHEHYYLDGNFYPQHIEHELTECDYEGGDIPIPPGLYLRNGTNPRHVFPGMSYHWFDGTGMIHGLYIKDGIPKYVNQYTKTPCYEIEGILGWPLRPSIADFLAPLKKSTLLKMVRGTILDKLLIGARSGSFNTANTALVYHSGRLMALMEQGPPVVIQLPQLDTLGTFDAEGQVAQFTAHPKVDQDTGEMIGFAYHPQPGNPCTYFLFDKTGDLVLKQEVKLPTSIMMHDFQATKTKSIFFDCPIVFSIPRRGEKRQGPPTILSWKPENGSRLVVVPRYFNGTKQQVFDIETCSVIHTLNSYDDPNDPDCVIVTAPRGTNTDLRSLSGGRDVKFAQMYLHMWRLNCKTGEVLERQLDNVSSEFPVINPAFAMKQNRFGYAGKFSQVDPRMFDGIVKWDFGSGVDTLGLLNGSIQVTTTVIDFPPLVYGGEPCFVPRNPGQVYKSEEDEDDGWLVVLIRDENVQSSEMWIYDAKTMKGPISKIKIPYRVPFGFHGLWVTEEQIRLQRALSQDPAILAIEKKQIAPSPTPGMITRLLTYGIGYLSSWF